MTHSPLLLFLSQSLPYLYILVIALYTPTSSIFTNKFLFLPHWEKKLNLLLIFPWWIKKGFPPKSSFNLRKISFPIISIEPYVEPLIKSSMIFSCRCGFVSSCRLYFILWCIIKRTSDNCWTKKKKRKIKQYRLTCFELVCFRQFNPICSMVQYFYGQNFCAWCI